MKNKGLTKKKLQIKSNWDKNLTLSINDQQLLKGGIEPIRNTTMRNCEMETETVGC